MGRKFSDSQPWSGAFFLNEPTGSHVKILEMVGQNQRILSVGCGKGMLEEQIRKKGNFVVGIEIDPNLAQEAKEHLDEVIVGDVELTELPGSYERSFDVLVLADVLEHLVRPERTLRRMISYLKDGGWVIASIPNFGYWRVRLKCLLGKFDYFEGGVLDQDHLRFFTRQTARRMLESNGINIMCEEPTASLESWKGKIDLFLNRFLRTWGAFQFVLKGQLVKRPELL